MGNAGVKKTQKVTSKSCVFVTEMLVSKELVHQDLRGVQQRALEEECKKAVCITLDNYNQALVQYMHVNTQMDRHMHTHTHPLMRMLKVKTSGDMVVLGGILKSKLLIEHVK